MEDPKIKEEVQARAMMAYRQLLNKETREIVEPLRKKVASLAEEVKALQGKIK